LDRFCAQHGDKQYALLEPKHVRRFRDEKVATPEAANGLIKAIRQVFAVALAYDLVKANPATQVGYLRSGSEGFHSWTETEIATFEGLHPVGTRARLAFALLLYTAQRRSDVVRFGPKMLKNGFLCFVQKRTNAGSR
jgi:site-specific recombinase XerD